MAADILGVVALMAFLGTPLLVLMWLGRRRRRRRGEIVPSVGVAVRDAVRDDVRDLDQAMTTTVEGLARSLGSLLLGLLVLVAVAVGLFGLVWIIKRMWEAA